MNKKSIGIIWMV